MEINEHVSFTSLNPTLVNEFVGFNEHYFDIDEYEEKLTKFEEILQAYSFNPQKQEFHSASLGNLHQMKEIEGPLKSYLSKFNSFDASNLKHLNGIKEILNDWKSDHTGIITSEEDRLKCLVNINKNLNYVSKRIKEFEHNISELSPECSSLEVEVLKREGELDKLKCEYKKVCDLEREIKRIENSQEFLNSKSGRTKEYLSKRLEELEKWKPILQETNNLKLELKNKSATLKENQTFIKGAKEDYQSLLIQENYILNQ